MCCDVGSRQCINNRDAKLAKIPAKALNNPFCRICEAVAGREALKRVGSGVAAIVDIDSVGETRFKQRLAVGNASGKQYHRSWAGGIEHSFGCLPLQGLAIGLPLSGYHQVGLKRFAAEIERFE